MVVLSLVILEYLILRGTAMAGLMTNLIDKISRQVIPSFLWVFCAGTLCDP